MRGRGVGDVDKRQGGGDKCYTVGVPKITIFHHFPEKVRARARACARVEISSGTLENYYFSSLFQTCLL